MIEVFVTNLGRYNEGELCGEYLKLPASKEEVKALLSRIGVDGILYEEFFITDYEIAVDGLYDCLGEYESLDELNYLAMLLSELNSWELETFKAALENGDYTGNVKDLINLCQNLDCYCLYPDIQNVEDLGHYYAFELGTMEVPEHLENYIDYEAYGRDIAIDTGGVFAANGYIEGGRDRFIEYYSGRDDLPPDCRISAFPDPPDRMPVKQLLELYASMSAVQALTDLYDEISQEDR